MKRKEKRALNAHFLKKYDKKSSLKQICKGCGKLFKNNYNSIYCLECEEIFYDEP